MDCSVLKNKKDSLKNIKIGIGVSGGADSVSLLLALINLKKQYNFNLYVITINHLMREESLSTKDAVFVMNLCKPFVKETIITEVFTKKLQKNAVKNLSKEKKIGLEAAARILRYNAFSDFINQHNLDYFCLAHNQNDQLETVLMRMLNGSSIESRAGIPLVREKYIRPLLNITRTQIEQYLKEHNQSYCTDYSNFEENFTRNKIRHKLIPLLNKEFSSWEKGILSCAKKDEQDGKLIKQIVEKEYLNVTKNVAQSKNSKKEICININNFLNLQKNIQIRVLLKAINYISLVDDNTRVPFSFLEDLIDSLKQNKAQNFIKTFSDNQFIVKNELLFIKKSKNINSKLFFSVIIEEDCKISFPFGNIFIQSQNSSLNKIVLINDFKTTLSFEYPIMIRNVCLQDYIIDNEQKEKKVSNILTDWKISQTDKDKVLVIQELNSKNQHLICILGKYCGFKDWVVKT